MSVALDMDVHVKLAITNGLRLRGVDVLTAQEDGSATLDDPDLLDRATFLDRALFSQDDDLLAEAHRRQASAQYFAGLVYVKQNRLTIGQIVHDLELIAKCCEPIDMANKVQFLPI